MILILIVLIIHVTAVVIRKEIAIAPQNKWSWQITAYNTRSTKFALSVVILDGLLYFRVPLLFRVGVHRANFVRVRETLW